MSKRAQAYGTSVAAFTSALAVAILTGCGGGGSSEPSGGGGSSSSTVGGASGSATPAGAGGSSSSVLGSGGIAGSPLVLDVGGSEASGGGPAAGNGMPEICDGIDNDANGIVDDVDAGHDGVCDCLNIATIGHIGPYSNGGNIFASWLQARSPLGAVDLADQELTPETLKRFQIVVSLHVATTGISETATAHHAFSDTEASAFESWVRAGGGAMTTIGYMSDEASEVVNVNKLLNRLGMGYSTSRFDLDGDVKKWLTHPVTDGISNIFISNGTEPDGSSGVSAAYAEDKVALQVSQAGAGRVAVWGDEWITYDSEWADVDGQQVEHFWLNLLKWLSPVTECQVPIPPRVK